jgi:phage terminase large subunit-like protein
MALRAGPKGSDHGSLPAEPVDDVEWFEHVTGTTLYTWQKEELRKALSPDRPGAYYLQVGRKNGKSYLAAAVGICQARRPDQHIYMVSDSERTLTNALFREMRDIIRRSPILDKAFVAYQTKFEIPCTGSFIQANSSKFSASQGVNPDLVLFDEVHLQPSGDTWTGYCQSVMKPGAMVYGITTPGKDLTGVAHGFYEAVRAGTLAGRIFEPDNPETAYEDRAQWPQANPRLLDDPDFMTALEDKHGSVSVPEYAFKRYHLGMWTAGATAWLPYGAWAALTAPRKLEPGTKVWLGFDGSVTGDSTALVACWGGGHITVLGVWERPGTKDWQVPKEEVLQAVDDAFTTYDVQVMFMDTAWWNREFQEWERLYGGPRVIQFRGTPKDMGPASEAFREAVVSGRISHDGDPRLARHVSNAVIKETPYGFVILKAAQHSPARIDLAWAAVAAYAATAAFPEKDTGLFIGSF